jgi:hypothetical protein
VLFLRGGVSELHGVTMSVEGQHPIEVALCEKSEMTGHTKNVKGENEAHHIGAHIRIASVHEQRDSVVKKRKKKGCRVVHAVTL